MNLPKLLIICLSIVTFNASAQIITTIAGNGSIGFGGDDGPATAASFNTPSFVAKDAAGNVYISDAGNNRIRKMNTAGIISTFAGRGSAGFSGDGGQATAALINAPQGITFDRAGNLYFCDMTNYCVRKISTSGIITTVAGMGGTPGSTGDGGPATAATMYNPTDVAFDTAGNMYIADMINSRIRMVDKAGNITTLTGPGGPGYGGDNGPATAATINHPWGIVVDTPGNIYFSDMENNRIRKISTSGIMTTIAGTGLYGFTGDGSPATGAQIDNPQGIAMDQKGNIYFADQESSAVRKITTSGIIYTLAGNNAPFFAGDGGPATAAYLDQPTGVWVDPGGNIYIADTGNNRIRYIGNGTEATPVLHGVQAGLSVYPNPGNGQFYVKLTTGAQEAVEVHVTDILGQTVSRMHCTTNAPYELTADVPTGVYFVTATTGEGTFNEKIVVVR